MKKETARTLFDEELDKLLKSAEDRIPDEVLPDLPFMEFADDVHDWYDFEHEIWEIGEDVRQLTLGHNKKFTPLQAERILRICEDERVKRGRQSFVLLLGKKRYSEYADRIAPLLSSDDVDGQVIDTLYKMGAFGYADEVRTFLNHNRTWIKNSAKRYLEKAEGETS